jgi:hypothetical protein
MAKKTRKARKMSGPMITQPVASEQGEEMSALTAASATRARPVSNAPIRTLTMAQAAVTFRTEYKYVLSDLRRTAILAAILFTAMIVLALVVTW